MRWRGVALSVVLVAALILFLARGVAERRAASRAATKGPTVAAQATEDMVAPPAEEAAGRMPDRAKETVRVEVVDATDGRPIAGAAVDAGDAIDSGTTDARGIASLILDRSEGFWLLVRRRGFVPATYWLEEDDTDPWIALLPGLPVMGRVLHADGKPASLAEVDVEFVLNAHMPVRPDASGSFEIPGLPVGEKARIGAHEEGYWPAEIEFVAAPDNTTLEIVLGVGGACEGVVVDDERRPVAGARVTVVNEDRGPTEALARTDQEGRFVIRGLSPDYGQVLQRGPPPWHLVECYRARAVATDHRNGMSERFSGDPDGPPEHCEIVVRPYAYVALALTFPDGTPVAEASVALSARESDWSNQIWCTQAIGTPGLFESGPVEPGENEIRVSMRGWPFQRRKIPVSPGVRNEIVFRLEEKLGVEGIVVDREGDPVRDIELELYEPRNGGDPVRIADALTDTDGRFRLRGLADTEGVLVCANGNTGYLPLEADMEPGQPPLRVVLERRPRIVGRLDPVPESRGLMTSIGCGDEWAGGSATVGRDGRFELRNMVVPARREFWLRLDVGGDLPWIFLGLKLAPDETLDLGTLRPPEGVTLEGVVTDQVGRPLAEAEVVAVAEIEELYTGGGADTDAKGRFAIHDLANVPLDVCATRDGYAPWKLRIEKPSAAPPLTIALEPGGALEVPATPWDVEAVEIEAVDGSHHDFLYTSRQDSSVVWLKPGTYRVNDSRLEIRVGETTRFELRK